MLDNLFVDYAQFNAAETDPDVQRWRALQPDLDCDLPDWVGSLDTTAGFLIGINAVVNAKITWLDSRATWQAPQETIRLESGDCMDIAIFKYAIMLQAGFDIANLGLVLGEIKSLAGNQAHAWLCVQVEGRRLVLDSKFPQLISPEDYINWRPMKLLMWDVCQLFGSITTINQQAKENPTA